MSDAFNQMLAQGPTPIKFADPINQMAQIMQLKNYQQTGVVNQMAIDKGQRQLADQATYRNMLAQPGFDVNDPATQARMLGLGGGEDLAAVGTMAKNRIDMDTRRQALDNETYEREVEGYKATAPYNGTREQLAQHFEFGMNNPILKTRGLFAQPGAREGFMAKLASDEGFAELQRISNLASGGVSQQDTAELAKTKAMEKYYDARAAAAGRPDAADAVKPLAINKMTIRDPKNPDRSIIVDANLQPDDPNYFLGEAPQSASALASQAKKEAADEAKQAGKQLVDNIIASLEQNVADLEAAGGLADTDKSAIENIGPFARSTKIGQVFGSMTGSKVQSILEIMKSNRLQLLNAMKTASGMSSKAVDSNQELKTWLESFGKEGGSKQAVLQIIKNLKSYGEGAGTAPPPAGSGPTAEDIAHTAKVHGVSEDEVKRRMGLQ
jgi:hypothetical protein